MIYFNFLDRRVENNMARKHENFEWGGYKYAPETVRFSLNGKYINFPEEVRSHLAYLAVCGEKEKLLIELKRALRAEEKKSRVVGKCICFFKKGSNDFYYTKQLIYDPDNLHDALRCYKEWKHYILSKDCILETAFIVTEGNFDPFRNNKQKVRTIENHVDLTRCRTIKIIRNSIY